LHIGSFKETLPSPLDNNVMVWHSLADVTAKQGETNMKRLLYASVAAVMLIAPAYSDGTTRQMYNDTFNSLMGRAIQFNVQPVHSCDGSLCHDTRTLPHVKGLTIILTSFSDGVHKSALSKKIIQATA
jgi:hypothetical protein